MALQILVTAGFPEPWAQLISKMWSNQHRWLTYGLAASEEPVIVSRSLPQGDAISPIALIIMMSAPLKALEQSHPSIQTSGFIDDRVSIAFPIPT